MPLQSWIEEQQNNSLFMGTGQAGNLAAKPLLEISKTNRIVNLTFARLAIAVRYLGIVDDWPELLKVVDMCEEYQLTIGDPTNSREAFIEAIKAQFTHYIRSKDLKASRGDMI